MAEISNEPPSEVQDMFISELISFTAYAAKDAARYHDNCDHQFISSLKNITDNLKFAQQIFNDFAPTQIMASTNIRKLEEKIRCIILKNEAQKDETVRAVNTKLSQGVTMLQQAMEMIKEIDYMELQTRALRQQQRECWLKFDDISSTSCRESSPLNQSQQQQQFGRIHSHPSIHQSDVESTAAISSVTKPLSSNVC